MAAKALNLVKLQRTPNADKNVAVMFWNYPPGEKNLSASFLNVPRSLRRVLDGMQAAGYDTTVIVVVTNTKKLSSVTPAASGPVTAGDASIDIEI